jgi:hypothetical protein
MMKSVKPSAVTPTTVGRYRKRYTEDGLAAITRRKADRIYERKTRRT